MDKIKEALDAAFDIAYDVMYDNYIDFEEELHYHGLLTSDLPGMKWEIFEKRANDLDDKEMTIFEDGWYPLKNYRTILRGKKELNAHVQKM